MFAKRHFLKLLILAATFLAARPVGAERLAVHTYTVADGLAGDQVTTIIQDQQGFLWIGTRTGLSRFDGAGFRSFDPTDGLRGASVWAILETADGVLWVGTRDGVVRMRRERSAEGLAFDPVPGTSRGVTALAEDPSGRIWVASADTLSRCDPPFDRPCAPVDTGISWSDGSGRSIEALVTDANGRLWLGTSIGLFWMDNGGPATPADLPIGDPPARVRDLLVDRQGRMWISSIGIARFTTGATGSPPKVKVSGIVRPALGDPMDHSVAFDLDEGPDGAVWVATHRGLAVVSDESVTQHHRATGLVTEHLTAVLVDDAGNAWIGTESHGLMRINSTGFTSYVESDGLASPRMASVTLAPSGAVVAITQPPEDMIHLLDGDRFVPIAIPLPELGPRQGWGINQVTFFDHRGKLWVPSPYGLFRFPRLTDLRDLPTASPEARYLPDNEVFRLFEDSRGDIWLGAFGASRLLRWERTTDTMRRYGPDDGVPFQAGTAFAEDDSGAVWVGFYTGGLARFRDGRIDFFGDERGLPGGMINCLLADRSGRLWVGGLTGGLGVTDDPAATDPAWRTVSTTDGRASEAVFSLAEDRFGRIYAGTYKGVDRIDPTSGRIEHFDTSSGLVNNLLCGAVTAPDGDIWFATGGGVTRYRPSDARPGSPPAVFVDRVTVDGADLTVPLRGIASVPRISLPSRTEVVDIGFAAVDLTPGSRLEFETSVGPGSATWSPTDGRRFVRLAGLSPGQHTVSIRARLPDGSVGPEAVVDLGIAIPLWRRWWFLASIVAVIAVTGWGVQRLRIQRLKDLHRVRSRIAADLHDEMGLSLARVAILADVAGQSSADSGTAETLTEIGRTARDLVDAASDMAWALDPRHDTVAALIARLRRLAGEVAEGSGATFSLEADSLDGVPMASEARRHLFLILKEAIRNACRHGRPDHLTLRIRRQASLLAITLEDDGAGFNTDAARDGQGLPNMKRRAAEMEAALSVTSNPGEGTRIELLVPFGSDA
ncbi:MAG: two-component regulator propeller domain-containing protein [Candidatus Sulfomarinibacteraceae bacterium]